MSNIGGGPFYSVCACVGGGGGGGGRERERETINFVSE